MLLWFLRNVVLRRFYTTMQLSRENKESTPVLEWFKVWLPRYMRTNRKMFHNVAKFRTAAMSILHVSQSLPSVLV